MENENETKQKGLLKKKKGGKVLTRKEVREIKDERKKLRKQMRKMGIKSRREFELTASSMGLYFDKQLGGGMLLWLLHGRALWTLLGSLLALLLGLFLFSMISQYRGHFTVNLDDDLFKNGFVLSETEDFSYPQTELLSDSVDNVPCISIASLPDDLEDWEGTHSDGRYFAYTFWIRNEGEDTSDYSYEVKVNSESQGLSDAVWVMLFENGEMSFYAKKDESGEREALPDYSDRSKGYRNPPYMDQAKYPSEQYEVIKETSRGTYYRLVPLPFDSDDTAVYGVYEGLAPGEVTKYTVVMWLEGDDPDCTDALIGGHLGLEMQFSLENSDEDQASEGFVETIIKAFKSIKENLKFWEE